MKTLFDKVWEKHVITGNESEAQLLYIDLHLIHEVTSPQAFSGLRIAERKVRRPDLTFGTMDHNTPTIMADRYNIVDETSKAQLDALKKNCEEFGIELADMFSEKNGIVHMVGPELGLTLPGKTVVCGDSHTATHGAFGAIAFGIGTSEVEHVLATQTLWQKKPKTMGIEISGKLQKGVYAKDIILHLIKTRAPLSLLHGHRLRHLSLPQSWARIAASEREQPVTPGGSFPANGHLKSRQPGQVAQLVEQRTENPCVGGSIPPLATRIRRPARDASPAGRPALGPAQVRCSLTLTRCQRSDWRDTRPA